jgi:hypothetical protein
MLEIVACSSCFCDQGLQLDALRTGVEESSKCPNCGSTQGRKLDVELLKHLAHTFFVRGTLQKLDYGAAPLVQFNQHQRTSISADPWLKPDLKVFEDKLRVGFFPYGPRMWMLGEIEPLKALQRPESRAKILRRVVSEYPKVALASQQLFYKVRVNPTVPADPGEYDSAPPAAHTDSRLASPALQMLYGSPDLQVCVHECRATAEDELFVATLAPTSTLTLLDLTEILREDGVTEFESLDLAIHTLFLAGTHSYDIARSIALGAKAAGYDGLVYPSYFSLLRTGGMPFETTYGLSHRIFARFADYEKGKIVPNLALFGRPVAEGKVSVKCINRLVMRRVEYDLSFGPARVDA